MTLSQKAVSQIANALKPEVIDYIYSSEKYAEFMQDMITTAISSKMGEMDEEVMFDLSMLVFDRIEFK